MSQEDVLIDDASQLSTSLSTASSPYQLQLSVQATPQELHDSSYPTPKELEYNPAIQAVTETEGSKPFSKCLSRRTVCPRDLVQQGAPLSPAPSQPGSFEVQNPKRKILPALPPSLFPEYFTQQVTPPPSRPTSLPPPRPTTPVISELPWRIYVDPTRQTSCEPPLWETNFTYLRCDTSLEFGNVISPTPMIGLPFGGMTEMACNYRSLEAKQEVSESSRYA